MGRNGRRAERPRVDGDRLAVAGQPEHLLDARPEGLRRAARLRRRGLRVARALRHAPFVRGLLLTGSTAAGDARRDADLDLLVVVAPGRIGTVFALLGPAASLTRRRLFCPNYYVSADRLDVAPRTLYTAREIAQISALAGDRGRFFAANSWMRDLLPNALCLDEGGLPCGGWLQRLLERPLSGRLGERLERRALRLAGARLAAHHAAQEEAVPGRAAADLAAGAALRFHSGGRARRVLDRHAAVREPLRRALEQRDERVA